LPTFSRSSAATLIDTPAARSAPSQISGQVIHLGAFADIRRAGAVWRDITQAYPPLERFHPSLIQNRDWNGQPFYQFEVGTPSRSDSEMLCQSMARLRYRCSVIGLRGKQTPQQQTVRR
jgi:hypothetical protein